MILIIKDCLSYFELISTLYFLLSLIYFLRNETVKELFSVLNYSAILYLNSFFKKLILLIFLLLSSCFSEVLS